jgi:acylphosphatase
MCAWVVGHVHGVGFRYFVLTEARALGITGWVANRTDGSVEVVAEGTPVALDRLEVKLQTGPASSAVRGCHTVRQDATGEFEAFEVKF